MQLFLAIALSPPAHSTSDWCASSEPSVIHTMSEVRQALGADSCKQAIRRLSRSRSLDLSDSEISDLSPLVDSRIEILLLRRNEITDITPLQSLPELRWLDLSQNPLGDLSPLSSCQKIETLWLGDTGAGDLAPLSALSALQHLGVRRSNVSSIAALEGLPLEYLGLGGNQVEDLRPLRRMKSLKALDISGNPVNPGWCPIKSATELRYKCAKLREETGWQADPSTVE
jgi:internalin A